MIKRPILLDLPMPIRTPRLVITPTYPEFAEQLFNAKMESIPELLEWMAWAVGDQGTLEDQKERMCKWQAEFILREELKMLVFTHDGEFVAATGLHRINWDIPRCDIGYWCKSSAQGNGYITEMANALTRYAFDVLKMRKVGIHVDKENMKSAAVANRLGFVHEYDDRGGITKPHTDELRIKSVYSCFDPAVLPALDISW